MKILRLIAAGILTFSILFTAFYGRYKILEENFDKTPANYKGVITLWQIDAFEGGTGSRKQFLLKVARGFEKVNQGLLVMVINYTADGAEQAMANGVYPDLISYGNGINLSGISQINCKTTCVGGMVGDKVYAVSWCRGGYALIVNPALSDTQKPTEIENLLVSQGEYTQPLAALALEGITAENIEVKQPMDAYIKFTAGKTPYFLATQRDLNRLKNRGMEFAVHPLTAYDDLYQYISVTSTDGNKQFYANAFIEYLLSEKVQKRLGDIGMYSPYYKTDYTDGDFISMQSAGDFNTISVFTQKEKLKEMQQISLSAATGDSTALNKIKKMLV